jgi:hypothetical protein
VVRRLANARAGVALAALALAACGGASPGLKVVSEDGVGFTLRCGETAIWEAAVVANEAKRTASVTSIGLDRAPAGFTLEWARVYRAPANAVDESRARRSVIGRSIPPAPAGSTAPSSPAWHVVVGLRPPDCLPTTRRPRFDAREYALRDGALLLGYRVGGDERRIRLGHRATVVVCAGREGCRP